MGECQGEQCEGEWVPELSESESGLLREEREEDVVELTVLPPRRAGGPVCGKREAGQRSVFRSSPMAGAAATDRPALVSETEICCNAGVADIGGVDVLQQM